MSVLPLDNRLHAGLLGDAEAAALMGEDAEIAAMIRVEIALAGVQARLGIIPAAAAGTISNRLGGAVIAPERLAKGVAKDGVVAPALVAALRAQLPDDVSGYLHFGATSQDIADCGLVLRLKAVLDLFDARLKALIGELARLAEAHRDTPCLAHTRMQAASPTLFGLKVAQWLAPLIRHRERLAGMRPRVLAVQLGGAAGNLSALGSDGPTVMDHLAEVLGLAKAAPWHATRDRLEELAGLFAMIATSCGKIGADLALMAQSEVGEVAFAGAGGSSTLPQKQNPVLAEILQTLARHAGMLAGGMHQAALQPNERDGAGWTFEWLILPQLVVTTGAALLRASEAISALRVDVDKMRANIETTHGLVLAEAASFALAAHLPREMAGALVKKAIVASLGSKRHLVDCLQALTDAPLDWAALRDPLTGLEPARLLLDRQIADAVASRDS